MPLVRRALPLLALVCSLTSPAAAQELVKPKMMVIFDSSGSMTFKPRTDRRCNYGCGAGFRCFDQDGSQGCPPGVPCRADGFCDPWTYGDGSTAYPGIDYDGNGQFDDSRMATLKRALRSTLSGVSELEFGLMRYAQLEGRNIRSSCNCSNCPGCVTFDNLVNQRSEYDVYPFGVGEGAINYDGGVACDFGGEVLVPVGDQTNNAIFEWIDGEETFPYGPGGNREIRGDGPTPIALSLLTAGQDFLQNVWPFDDRLSCRNYYVLLLTDGEETCNLPGDAVDIAGQLNDLDFNGQPKPIRTFVIGFGEDTQGSPVLNAIAAAGGTEQAFFADDEESLQLALAEIIQRAIPQETCNNRDDDCDGRVDEDLLRACATDCGQGTEVCQRGVWQGCDAVQPEAEVCNAIDDDCDGNTDEGEAGPLREDCANDCGGGERVCVDGVLTECSAPTPRDEVCNGNDDDCDGSTDEGVTRACQTACGVCQQVCVGGGFAACAAPQPHPEACNGADDDCDGNADEALTRACQTACGAGRETCNAGAWVGCDARVPADELCNGRDDDCDGEADEQLTRACASACGEGVETCRNGGFAGCTAPAPAPEVCNGQD
ncbi:MAG: hypothetical protein KC583_04210, partial [Myxococcales bacterium]|nr:hypothetical protein [Myxococcales bacterium]